MNILLRLDKDISERLERMNYARGGGPTRAGKRTQIITELLNEHLPKKSELPKAPKRKKPKNAKQNKSRSL